MRRVPRGQAPAPKALSALNKGLTELQRAEAHFGGARVKPGAFKFAVYKADEVKARLDALFHGKCAYCETVYASTAPVDVEHFRPKGRVEGDKTHRGYWWLAMAWENLLPSCIDCNRRRKQPTPKVFSQSLQHLDRQARKSSPLGVILTGKKDLFPVGGVRAMGPNGDLVAEAAYLLDPCVDEPADHLVFHTGPHIPVGLVLAKSNGDEAPQLPAAQSNPEEVALVAAAAGASVRGAVSIQVFGLNRLALIQERTRLLRRLEFLEMMSVEIGLIVQKLEGKTDRDVKAAVQRLELLQDQILGEMRAMAAPEAPYSVMVATWIEGFKARLAQP
ncbi:HNH endonuclease [Phenylobacterium sp.]|uniref:HNH endonuclease n=1 Tax=Phenylobacterium sp. TaxID=1871053 RepID=UPI0025FF5065|nr:HNH endonuclease [Phenylobacterium sp.]